MEKIALPSSLQDAEVTTLPESAYYIPEFLSVEEEQTLLDQIQNRPLRDWKVLTKRRLQAWPSPLNNNKLMAGPLPQWLANPVVNRLLNIPLTSGHEPDVEASGAAPTNIFARAPHGQPNHVLINEYEPGTGIMPHTDGPAYYPVVATVSLGAPIVLDIHEKSVNGGLVRTPKFRILQEPRSLLITTAELYTDYLHGIADVTEDTDIDSETIANWTNLGRRDDYQSGSYTRRVRTSLTFRDVPQVIKPSKLFPGLTPKGK